MNLRLPDPMLTRPAELPHRRRNWRPGDAIPFGAMRTLRVVEVRDDDADEAPVLVVEDVLLGAAEAD